MKALHIMTGHELYEGHAVGYKSNFKLFNHDYTEHGYIILYHDDFDGLASAALFSLRGAPTLSISKDKCIYHPIQFENTIDFKKLEDTVKERLNVHHIWYIFLDFNFHNHPGLIHAKGKAFLTIDHHSQCPKEGALIVVHDANILSCAQLVAKTFPSVNSLEDEEAVARVLHAADILDYGDSDNPEITFREVLSTPPGCIVFYNVNSKLKTNNALKLILDYMTVGVDEQGQQLFNHFINLNNKVIEYIPIPSKEYKYGKLTFGMYTFSNSRMDNLFFGISVFKAYNMLNDFTVLIKKVTNNFYRVSVRTNSKELDAQKFCTNFGGGGKQRRSGGFGLTTSNLEKSLDDMKEYFEREIVYGTSDN
jgi:nanoRNase/pAp phosphatase (c-di-AMP/oligoRNAs hydrolase)